MLDSVTRKVNVKVGSGGRRKVMGVVRENYLRTDLPCLSHLCFENCSVKEDQILLPSTGTHYLIPLEDVVKHYFDVLNSPEIKGIIFMQTVVNSIQNASQRHYRKICDLIRCKDKQSVFFPNEFCKFTAIDSKIRRDSGEYVKDLNAHRVFKAANWYYEHLGGQKPIIIITEDKDIVAKLEAMRLEIFVMTLGDYLEKFWPNLTDAIELYQGIFGALSNVEEDMEKEEDYVDYLKLNVLEAGLRQGKFVKGRLNVNKHHASEEAFVIRNSNNDEKTADNDVLIPGMILRNRAVHGDIVVAQLMPKSEWKSKLNRLTTAQNDQENEEWERRADVMPTGRIVGVLERNWGEYVATISKEEAKTVEKRAGRRILVYPYDYRIPKIRVLTSQAKRLITERIVVQIDNWPVNSQYPNGHFVRSLGKIGDLETELDGILLENNISISPFSQGILSEMPSSDWKPSQEEISQRKDLRESHMVMSIDPKGCEDVDDTLSLRKLTNGNLELGVHIADVTHFVPFNSLTDLEARRRATTVYLADRRYDMLPSVLSSNICSLIGGVDRFAVSVLWEIHPKTHEVISVWYGRTVIKSSYKLSYEVAQDILDDQKSAQDIQKDIPELEGFSGQGLAKKFKILKNTLQGMTNIAHSIQVRREKQGAIKLESSEVQFEFESADLSDMRAKEHLQVHEVVAEFMIFANHWVAKKISKTFPINSLLRRHPPPKKENFEELKKCASSKGWRISIWGNRVLSESLNDCQDPNDPMVNYLLRSLATYAMVQAVYFSTGSVKQEDWEHYGLALSHYTHFTSPIRRYADILVHRLLLAALEHQDWWSDLDKEAKKRSLIPNYELQDLSQHINERNRSAQNAQRSSQILFQTLYFKDKEVDDPRCIVEAVIFSIRDNGLLVYIPRYALKGPVLMQNKEGQVLFHKKNFGPFWTEGKLRQTEFSLVVENSNGKSQEYRLFDHVTVTIQMIESYAHPSKLAFYFLNKKKLETKKSENGSEKVTLEKEEVNFLKEIRKELDEAMGREENGDPISDDDVEDMEIVNEGSGSPNQGKSMYKFFQDLKLMGIRTDT